MKYALTGRMSKEVDRYTIDKMGVPSLVLMERAAVSTATKVAEIVALFRRNVRILAVCAKGNNGADAAAAARILSWQGVAVDIAVIEDDRNGTEEFATQITIAKNSGLNFVTVSAIPEYDIIIDGIFGTGLSRDVGGIYADAIDLINGSNNVVVSVDIPSGIDSETGAVLSKAVNADATVTFGYNKVGNMIYPGKELSGEVTVADIGFCPEAIKTLNPCMYFTEEDLKKIPDREAYSNKGTYGRILVIAGSRDMSGAAYLSGAAAYRTGAGLVEVLTYEGNTDIIKKLLPEAIVTGYSEDNYAGVLESCLKKATCVILGPGLSKDIAAHNITEEVLRRCEVPLIIDADALNIIAEDISLLKNYSRVAIITPHIGELVRLTGLTKEELLNDSVAAAKRFAKEFNVILVMKNAVTVVAEPYENGRVYINASGTGAMSKAGMGDVLTGVVAGMISLRLEPFSAACMGVYLHGIAGEIAEEEQGTHSVMAGDVVNTLGKAVNK